MNYYKIINLLNYGSIINKKIIKLRRENHNFHSFFLTILF